MSIKTNLEKSKNNLASSFNQKGVHAPPTAELGFDLDVSNSFDDEHRDGLTQALLMRLVPWGMLFDPDQKMDIFTFSDGSDRSIYVGEITPDTCEKYIQKNIIGEVPGYGGGTDYSYVIQKNLQHFGWTEGGAFLPLKKKSRISSFFRREQKVETVKVRQKRSLIIFVTDGECNPSDEERTRQILQASEDRKDRVYFLLIGISNQGVEFKFLQEIADRFANTGLVVIEDLKGFVQKTDEEINVELIGDELVEWLKID